MRVIAKRARRGRGGFRPHPGHRALTVVVLVLVMLGATVAHPLGQGERPAREVLPGARGRGVGRRPDARPAAAGLRQLQRRLPGPGPATRSTRHRHARQTRRPTTTGVLRRPDPGAGPGRRQQLPSSSPRPAAACSTAAPRATTSCSKPTTARSSTPWAGVPASGGVRRRQGPVLKASTCSRRTSRPTPSSPAATSSSTRAPR